LANGQAKLTVKKAYNAIAANSIGISKRAL
jgi:hypothetical protein